jgi:uncharacterized protein YcfJ
MHVAALVRDAKKCQGVVARPSSCVDKQNCCRDRRSGKNAVPTTRIRTEMNLPLKSTALAVSAFALLGAAGAAQAAEYGNVVSATPVTGSFPVPRQQCAEGTQVVPAQPSGGGALVGAIIGGLVGNQFGHGSGRAVATGIGAVAGAGIGNHVEMVNHPGQVVPVRDCRTVSSYETRVVGYDVVYEYQGQRYTTRTERDPGPRIAIDARSYGAPSYDDRAPRGGQPVPPAGYGEPSYEQAPPARYPAPAATYPAPAVGYPVPSVSYYPAPAPVYAPAPAYYPAPVYYGGPRYYGPPAVSIGFSTGYGWRGHRYWR